MVLVAAWLLNAAYFKTTLTAANGFSLCHPSVCFAAVPTMHQILLSRADTDYPADAPPPLRAIRSCSSSLAPATLHKLEAAFKAPVLEVSLDQSHALFAVR